MIVPYRRLSQEALKGVIEEFVTRDGTDLSEASTKSTAVLAALDRGELLLVFDPETESCNLLPPEEAEQALQAHQAEPDGSNS